MIHSHSVGCETLKFAYTRAIDIYVVWKTSISHVLHLWPHFSYVLDLWQYILDTLTFKSYKLVTGKEMLNNCWVSMVTELKNWQLHLGHLQFPVPIQVATQLKLFKNYMALKLKKNQYLLHLLNANVIK